MGKITSIELQKRRKGWVNLFVNDAFALALDAEVVARAGLQVGQEVSTELIEKLKNIDLFQSCLAVALRLLSYRPRSEAEIRERLHRRGFNNDAVQKVIIRLKEQRLIDDAAFAQFWKDNRLSFSPRGKRLIEQELRQKGVVTETVDEVTEGLDDEAAAYEAGRKRARFLATSDYREFRQRLAAYLRRRGFGYEVISRTTARLWQERESSLK